MATNTDSVRPRSANAMTAIAVVPILPLCFALACGSQMAVLSPSTTVASSTGSPVTTIANAGFALPENIVYDSLADVYLISNINGGARAKDANGFISRVAADGRVLQLKWIDGSRAETRLDGPKGIAINGDTIAVADVGAVRFFNTRTGASLGVRTLPGELMNDVAFGKDGSVYVTDTGPDAGKPDSADHDAIYRLYPDGRTVTIARSADLAGPDGIVVTDSGVVYATFKGHVIEAIAGSGARRTVMNMPGGRDDGLRLLPDGSYVVTSWDTKTVYRMQDGGTLLPVLTGVTSPAGVALDTRRQTLAVTSMQDNKLYLLPLR
ncbi:MAG: SMP-30/gluconolactonase/LRE family protein [Gemmatimonadota bacterium]|nr:SMP-30/gluconolactonase/LRE family protein [Gemmatimonadota bacterium]